MPANPTPSPPLDPSSDGLVVVRSTKFVVISEDFFRQLVAAAYRPLLPHAEVDDSGTVKPITPLLEEPDDAPARFQSFYEAKAFMAPAGIPSPTVDDTRRGPDDEPEEDTNSGEPD